MKPMSRALTLNSAPESSKAVYQGVPPGTVPGTQSVRVRRQSTTGYPEPQCRVHGVFGIDLTGRLLSLWSWLRSREGRLVLTCSLERHAGVSLLSRACPDERERDHLPFASSPWSRPLIPHKEVVMRTMSQVILA